MAPSELNLLFADTVKICQELIQIPSVNYGEGKGDEIAVSEYVANFLKTQGLQPEIIKLVKIVPMWLQRFLVRIHHFLG